MALPPLGKYKPGELSVGLKPWEVPTRRVKCRVEPWEVPTRRVECRVKPWEVPTKRV
jgi:hypothetical protein